MAAAGYSGFGGGWGGYGPGYGIGIAPYIGYGIGIAPYIEYGIGVVPAIDAVPAVGAYDIGYPGYGCYGSYGCYCERGGDGHRGMDERGRGSEQNPR